MDRASTVIASALLLLLPVMGQAQQNGRKPPRNDAAPKKLYCWNEGGERICSDARPGNAVNNAREEFSAETGLRRGQVGAALDADGRAAAAAAAAQQRLDEMAQQNRQRTEQAMLLNYADEAALRAVFAERAAILDNNIATARYNVASLREGLVTALAGAAERELSAAKVSDKQVQVIHQRHGELLVQQRMQASFERQRSELDTEIASTVLRFRTLKGT